jgi:hypothetical protein
MALPMRALQWVVSSHGRETSDLSAELRMETLTDWTAPRMSAPLPPGTVHQLAASIVARQALLPLDSAPACLS